MNPRGIQLTPTQRGMREDDQFFREHRRRQFRIRVPTEQEDGPPEFDAEFRSLGEHDASRRRIIVKRLDPFRVMISGLKYMPIPFLLFGDESIEDDDSILEPVFEGIMRDAAASYAR